MRRRTTIAIAALLMAIFLASFIQFVILTR